MELLVLSFLAAGTVSAQPGVMKDVNALAHQSQLEQSKSVNDSKKCQPQAGIADDTSHRTRQLRIPRPEQAPLSIDFASDPILEYVNRIATASMFCRFARTAILNHPSLTEVRSGRIEAIAAKREARSSLFPTVDVNISNRTSIFRNFGTGTDNVVERARARGRTDATFSVQQRIFDFGAAPSRYSAAGARMEAARFEVERQADEIALSAIGIWYDVFAYRALIKISSNMTTRHAELQNDMDTRIAAGASARGDRSRIDGYIATHIAQHEVFERQLAEAEARFLELFRTQPPTDLVRTSAVELNFPNEDSLLNLAHQNPVVKLVQAQARSAQLEARASRADTLPRVNAGLEGGRFGVFDSNNDYDVRGTLSLTHRFFGNGDARADQARARADAAKARVARVKNEAVTQITVALSNLKALKRQAIATEKGYIAQRQSRDVLFERFRLTRGTLFDVMESDRALLDATISHIQTTSERDVAQYILLSRIGKLLAEFGISSRELMEPN